MTSEDTFICRDCKYEFPVGESVKDASRARGIMERCKGCARDRGAARRADPVKGKVQRERVTAAMRRRREEQPDWQRMGPDQKEVHRTRNRLAARAKAYAVIGASDEDYVWQLAQQNGRCFICGRDVPTHGDERFCFDHDHEQAQRRGLLCRPCNLAIGHLADNPEHLQAAIKYLTRDWALYWLMHEHGADADQGTLDVLAKYGSPVFAVHGGFPPRS